MIGSVTKTAALLLLAAFGLFGRSASAQPGLKGEYFTGINFDRKVFTRIDPQISFDWRGRQPGPGIGESYFSVRWTGKLRAPASGKYVFSATVDDGVRIWVDNKKIVDEWRLNDDVKVRGEIVLEAGKYYDLRVEYFNDMLEGLIILLWYRPDMPTVVNNGKTVPAPNVSPIIDAQYLSRTAPVPPKRVVPPPKPAVKPVAVAPKLRAVGKPVSTSAATAKPRPAVVVTAAPTPTPPPSATSAAPKREPVAETFGTLETGRTLVLENVFFEQSKYVLLPTSYAELDKLVRTLQQNPAVRIEIAGHTDNVGDPRLNQLLSEYRARVVMNYLTRHGIAESRVEATGYGGSRPFNGNTTESERARNRRVAFVVK